MKCFSKEKLGPRVVWCIFLLCLEIDVKFFAGSAEVSNLFRLVEILRNLFQRLVEFGIGQAERR